MHCVNIEVFMLQAAAVPSSWMHQWQDEDTRAALEAGRQCAGQQHAAG